MRKLAEAAGVAVKTLYNLFGGREAILQALVSDSMDQMDATLDAVAPLDDPLTRCRAVVTVSIGHMLESEALSRAMVLARYQGLSEVQPARAMSQRAAQMQAVALRAGIEQGIFHSALDPDVLASQIYHGYELAHIQWAYGLIDAEEFETRALYGVYLALLAIAAPAIQGETIRELRRLEVLLEEKFRDAVGSDSDRDGMRRTSAP